MSIRLLVVAVLTTEADGVVLDGDVAGAVGGVDAAVAAEGIKGHGGRHLGGHGGAVGVEVNRLDGVALGVVGLGDVAVELGQASGEAIGVSCTLLTIYDEFLEALSFCCV